MANEVYLLTHNALSQMIPARAATRFLEKALEAKGLSPESVTSERMREILQGPILRDLGQILPKDGVERSIKQISRNLKKQAEQETESVLVTTTLPTTTLPTTTLPVPSSLETTAPTLLPPVLGDVLLTDDDSTAGQVMTYGAAEADLGIVRHTSLLEDSQAFDTGEVEAALEHAFGGTLSPTPKSLGKPGIPDTVEVISEASVDAEVLTAATLSPVASPSPASTRQPSQAPQQTAHKAFSPDVVAQMLVKFAQLEHVKVVAAVKTNGEISMSRGTGFDVDALSRLGSLGMKLLGRERTIRSYYVSQSHYQLFMFPLYTSHIHTQTLIVVGSSDVNVGEVFSVRSHLEEDL